MRQVDFSSSLNVVPALTKKRLKKKIEIGVKASKTKLKSSSLQTKRGSSQKAKKSQFSMSESDVKKMSDFISNICFGEDENLSAEGESSKDIMSFKDFKKLEFDFDEGDSSKNKTKVITESKNKKNTLKIENYNVKKFAREMSDVFANEVLGGNFSLEDSAILPEKSDDYIKVKDEDANKSDVLIDPKPQFNLDNHTAEHSLDFDFEKNNSFLLYNNDIDLSDELGNSKSFSKTFVKDTMSLFTDDSSDIADCSIYTEGIKKEQTHTQMAVKIEKQSDISSIEDSSRAKNKSKTSKRIANIILKAANSKSKSIKKDLPKQNIPSFDGISLNSVSKAKSSQSTLLKKKKALKDKGIPEKSGLDKNKPSFTLNHGYNNILIKSFFNGGYKL